MRRSAQHRRAGLARADDLDHFKKLNDSQGHQDGDEALRAVAALLAERTESRGGLAARFGGEEFAWLLPGVTLCRHPIETFPFRLLWRALRRYAIASQWNCASASV